MSQRPLEDDVDEYVRSGRIVSRTGLVNLSGGASSLSGTRVFVESKQDKQRRAAPKFKRTEWLGMTLEEQCKVEKQCTKCRGWFPATCNYWHANYTGQYGLYSICIPCKATLDQKRYDLEQRKNMRVLLKNTNSPKT